MNAYKGYLLLDSEPSWLDCLPCHDLGFNVSLVLSLMLKHQEMSNFTLTDRYNAIIRINCRILRSHHTAD